MAFWAMLIVEGLINRFSHHKINREVVAVTDKVNYIKDDGLLKIS